MKRLGVGSRCSVAKVVQKSRMQRNVYLVEKLNNHVGTREWGREKEWDRERKKEREAVGTVVGKKVEGARFAGTV